MTSMSPTLLHRVRRYDVSSDQASAASRALRAAINERTQSAVYADPVTNIISIEELA